MNLSSRTLATAAWLAFAALLGWWLAPAAPPAPRLVAGVGQPWTLADLPRRPDLTAQAGRVMAASYWGGPDTPLLAEPPPADPRWRVAAIYGAGKDRTLLVLFNDPARQPARLKLGEALPSGHKIVEIGERDYCVRVDKKMYRLGVERSER